MQATATHIDHKRKRVTCSATRPLQLLSASSPPPPPSGVLPPGAAGNTSPSVVETFEVEYDVLVVAVGAINNTFNTPGVEENCLFLKVTSMRLLMGENCLYFDPSYFL